MWQSIIVIIIVAVAAATVIRQFVRTLKGRRACDIDQCAACPFGEGCGHKEHEDRP
jgi:hypothetical protein